MSAPRIGELFAGYGGLGLGVQAVYGGEVAWVSEFDKGANKILAHRFPDVPNHGDITKIDWAAVEPVDILTGGSPCQDLSHAGRRAGMTEGTRSNLWVAMREAIAQLRPPMVVWENVRGANSAAADSALESDPGLLAGVRRRGGEPVLRALGRVLGDLSSLGYDTSWHGLRAADVGAPHGRFRYFVVATDAEHDGSLADALRRGAGPSSGIGRLLEPQGSPADPRVTLLSTPQSRDHKGVPGDDFNQACLARDVSLLPTPAVNDMGDRPWATPETWDAWVEKHKASGINGNGHGKSLAIEAQRLLPTPTTTQRGTDANLDTREGARANLHNEVVSLTEADPVERYLERIESLGPDPVLQGRIDRQRSLKWGEYAPAIARWEHIHGRPAPAPTQTSTKGNPQLSARFVEWMMGLPDGWVTDVPGITRNEALKALGNGVVPAQAAEALRVMASWAVAA